MLMRKTRRGGSLEEGHALKSFHLLPRQADQELAITRLGQSRSSHLILLHRDELMLSRYSKLPVITTAMQVGGYPQGRLKGAVTLVSHTCLLLSDRTYVC